MAHPDRLLAAAQSGDEAAWGKIVAELGPMLQGYARAKGVADAEDLMQEVFLAAAGGIGGFEGTWDNFRSWVFTIAYRRIADAHRRTQRKPAMVSVEAASRLADTAAGPETALVENERFGAALAALESLSPVERDVVLLRVIAELDSEEVGRILGKRQGTVRVIQSRAIKKIRQIVQDA